jgi:cob(I)alamin adenosyltransferase
MTKIKLNNYECEIDSYSRTTNISDGNINGSGYINVLNGDVDELNALLGTTITSIEIYVDERKIYELHDIDAEVNTLNEYLSGDKMAYNLNLTFKFNT